MNSALNVKKHLFIYKGLPPDVYILFAAIVVNRMGSFIMPLLTLILTVKAGYSDSSAGLISTIAIASEAPFLILGGKLADRFGSKRTIVIFESAGALIYLICGFLKPGLAVVVLIIAASDLFATASPAFTAIIAEVTPPSSIKNAYSLTYLGNNLGLAVGPAVGGLLFNDHLNLLFVLDAATALLATALVLLKVRGTRAEVSPAETDAADIDGSMSVIELLRRNPALIVFSMILLIYNFCYIQWNFLLPLQLVDLFTKNGSRLFSLLFSTNAMIVIILTMFLTSLTRHVKPVRSIAAGGVFYAASYMIFAFSSIEPLFYIGVIVMTLGEILISYNINSYIALRVPKTHYSRTNSLLALVTGTGYAIGPMAMGSILAATTIHYAWIIVFILMAFGAFSMMVFQRCRIS